jgi:diguanylate cyclase (GGDEF)-like protein
MSADARRLVTPRLIVTIGLLALSAAFLCGIISYLLLHRADDRQELERRGQLVNAIQDIRATGADISELDPQFLRSLETIFGLKGLRFETEFASGLREVQPALDKDGRIVGWFTWERDQSMAETLSELQPWIISSALGLLGFAVLALWQIRRGVRALADGEQRAWRLANADLLTGLPNLRKMVELIDSELTARAPGKVVSLAVLDIDGLNEVNAAHGRHIGNALLTSFSERLRQTSAVLVGRTGDDEFALVLNGTDSQDVVDEIAEISRALTRPYWLGDQAVQIGVTVGVAHALYDGIGRDELMRRADLALRAAKRKNRGGTSEFKPAIDAEFTERRFIENELRRALEEKTLDLHYQPIVTADGTRVTGVEALLRWIHPVRGVIPPADFVPVAEQSGLISKLGEWVLRRALSDAKRWPSLSISINISPVQVRDPAFVNLVISCLTESGVTPSRVVFEMTEGVLIENPDEAKRRLDALHSIGVQIALDDFGAGYSSLTYLQRFRFDRLKIDQGFVQSLGHSLGGEAIIQAIVALGRALGLTITAEGVETEEQRVLLRLAGCEEMQGFLFARPTPRDNIDRLLVETNGSGSRSILRVAGFSA